MAKEKPEEASKFCIELDENYRITSDPYNYILQRKSKTNWATVGYYARIEHILDDILDMKIRESEVKSLTALQAQIRKIRKEIAGYGERLV